MATVERVNGQRALADGLGVSLGLVAKLKKAGVLGEVPGEPGVFDLDLARRALAAHRRGEALTPAPAAPVAPVPPAAPRFPIPPPVSPNELTAARTLSSAVLDAANLQDRAILESAADPLETARASARVAARLLAQFMGTPLAPEALESVKRSLDGLRLFEADALELGVRRGELVPRDILRVLGGTLGARATALFDRVGVRLPAQVEEWLGDEKFLGATVAERAVVVREWWGKLARAARTSEAEDVEKIVAAELADREKEK